MTRACQHFEALEKALKFENFFEETRAAISQKNLPITLQNNEGQKKMFYCPRDASDLGRVVKLYSC